MYVGRLRPLFMVTSGYALAELKYLRLRFSPTVESRSTAIRQLGLRLTEILRHDLVTRFSKPGHSHAMSDWRLRHFPWHGAMQHFVVYFLDEMGALLRFLAVSDSVADSSESVRQYYYQAFCAAPTLFPASSSADSTLGVIISSHPAQRSSLSCISCPENIPPTEGIGASRHTGTKCELAEGLGPGSVLSAGSQICSHVDEHTLFSGSQLDSPQKADVLPTDESKAVPSAAADTPDDNGLSSSEAEESTTSPPTRRD
jgi:hypothetical protein